MVKNWLFVLVAIAAAVCIAPVGTEGMMTSFDGLQRLIGSG
jgi:hypothetical protein